MCYILRVSYVEVSFSKAVFLCFSSNVRQRGIEERKRNLANKVDEIKKKMKNHEQNDDSFNSKVIGLVLCAVVVGLAYLYYYR